MTELRVAPEVFLRDLERIREHLLAHEAAHIEQRLSTLLDAIEILREHPRIGRPVLEDLRELVIGKGSRGYLALYRYDPAEDAVDVLAIRSQRERWFADLGG
jgi:toxin ParE1/3/4